MNLHRHNRRANDLTPAKLCMELVFLKMDTSRNVVSFTCGRLRNHEGPHVHREIGETRVGGFDEPAVDTNFNVMWYTK